MMNINLYMFTFTIIIVSLIVNLALSLYGVLVKPNIVKKIISLTILGDSANTFAILIGYRAIYPVSPPVQLNIPPSPSDVFQLTSLSVDPLPQALVLTAIVIGLAVNIFLIFLAIQIHRLYGTLDMREIARIKGVGYE
ncbi:MAG: sodium:proton antiporter [Candidatus Methanomethylicia archaeon]